MSGKNRKRSRWATGADFPPRRDPKTGSRLCRWCNGKLTGRRTSWCSDRCVDRYLLVSDPRHARQKVFERDRGICVECGMNCDKEYSARYARFTEAWEVRAPEVAAEWDAMPRDERPHGMRFRFIEDARRALFLEIVGVHDGRNSLWDVDHIKPVAHGGGMCGLDNLQTLCIDCHKRKTKEQVSK